MKYKLFNEFAKESTEIFGVEEGDIFSKNKSREVVDSRYLLYYLCKINNIQLIYIQNYMKKRGYDIPKSTIHYGIKEVSKKIENDKDYRIHVKRIVQKCIH